MLADSSPLAARPSKQPSWQIEPGPSRVRVALDLLIKSIATKPDGIEAKDWVARTDDCRVAIFTLHALGLEPEMIVREVGNPDLLPESILRTITLCLATDFSHLLISMKGL